MEQPCCSWALEAVQMSRRMWQGELPTLKQPQPGKRGGRGGGPAEGIPLAISDNPLLPPPSYYAQSLNRSTMSWCTKLLGSGMSTSCLRVLGVQSSLCAFEGGGNTEGHQDMPPAPLTPSTFTCTPQEQESQSSSSSSSSFLPLANQWPGNN